MQKHIEIAEFCEITPTAEVSADRHGGRAKCLQRLIRLDLPVPKTVALSFVAVRAIATGHMVDLDALSAGFEADKLLSVRPSSQDPDWGGPGAILNIGMNSARHAALCKTVGKTSADALYRRFIRAFAIHVAHLDADPFEGTDDIAALLEIYAEEMDEPFPENRREQLAGVLTSMARAWDGTSARLLRQAKGAPADAGLGLVVQEMAIGLGRPESGSGVLQLVSPKTGQPQVTGRYLSQSQGRDAISVNEGAIYLTRDPRGPSLEELCPDVFDELQEYGGRCRMRLREEMQLEFTIEAGKLSILDAVRVPRNARADVRIAVALSRDGIIPTSEAVARIAPRALIELLHNQVDPEGPRDVFARGIAASPGAAVGRIYFSSEAAQKAAAGNEPVILVRRETTPEDIRGMHASVGVLTERGGTTSHAAVIARGLGLPCVVGASRLRLSTREGTLTGDDGRVFAEGDLITIDGASGEALAGEARLLEPALDDAFHTLLGWADEHRDMDVRANADTPAEARVARAFDAQGIGLCRTEHMFFDDDRLVVMREMIFADAAEDRAAVVERLLPMQRADFAELFSVMHGLPVCIRLFDPPLHEFLPTDKRGLRQLADALGLSMSHVARRVEALSEVNPMLGLRGVRLGISMPEIYDMQGACDLRSRCRGGRARRVDLPRDHGAAGVGQARDGTRQGAHRSGGRGRAKRDRCRVRLPAWRHGRNAARGAQGRRDCRVVEFHEFRHERLDADDLRAFARRRRAVHERLCAAGRVRRGPVPPA